MKHPRFLRFLAPLTFAAALLAGGAALRAGDAPSPAKQLNLTIDRAPIDRDAPPKTSFAAVVKRAAPSVVYVFSTKKVRAQMENPFFNDPMFRQFFGIPDQQPERMEKQQSLGSGVIVSPDGYILTNNHVVAGADEVKVAFGDPRREYKAVIVGRDPRADVAVLKIDATGLPAAVLGDSDQLEVGDVVLAIGNPFNLGQTVTHGIVSALGRDNLGIEDYEDFIQTDAPINPGNSGGALLDAEGRVVGINTAIYSRSGGSNGLGFAIPIDLARSLAEQLVRTGRIERGFLGVRMQEITPDLAAQFGTSRGALVDDVDKGSPADKAGLKSGDIVTGLGDRDTPNPHALQRAVAQVAPGTTVEVRYLRNGKPGTAKVTLTEAPSTQTASNDNGTGNDVGVLNHVTVADLTAAVRDQLQLPADLQGAVITDVDPDSASAEAGLQRGDVIMGLDGQPVAGADDAVKLSATIKGPKVTVRFWREGSSHYVVVDESGDSQ